LSAFGVPASAGPVFGVPALAGSASGVPASAGLKQTTNSPPARETKRQPDFPAAIQARVERITQSEIFAAVVRPMPMALLGIAGKDVFLRAPNGQTGLIRQGEELGGVKLLRIGVNRVLVEENGQQKELMLFSGFGGEPLLPKGEKSPRELTTQP